MGKRRRRHRNPLAMPPSPPIPTPYLRLATLGVLAVAALLIGLSVALPVREGIELLSMVLTRG